MSEQLEEGVFSPKDYQTNYINLISSDGREIPIVAMVAEIVIHQSIDASTMFGSIVVGDAQDLLANFFVNGGELLKISIDKSSLNNPLEKTFRIYKIAKRTHTNNSGAKYMLYFTSQEMILSTTQIVSKAYKNKTVSDIARDIFSSYLNTTKVNRFEQTTGTHNYVISEKRPFEALNWLASRSYTADPAYAFHCFESRDGFEFVSLQTLFKQTPVRKLIYDIKNTNDQPNSSSDVGKNKDSLSNLQIVHDFDVLRMIAEGAYSSNLLKINLLNQSFEVAEYSLSVFENQGLLLNQHMTINDKGLYDSPQSCNKVYVETPETSDEKASEIDKWMIPGRMHRSLINSYRIKATLAGDLTLRPGDIVEITVNKFVAADEEGKELDEFRSGKYMIADITHIFRSAGIVDSVIEFVSNSFSSNLPSAKDLSKIAQK